MHVVLLLSVVVLLSVLAVALDVAWAYLTSAMIRVNPVAGYVVMAAYIIAFVLAAIVVAIKDRTAGGMIYYIVLDIVYVLAIVLL